MLVPERGVTISILTKDRDFTVSQSMVTEEMYACYYLDHTFVDPKKLAFISSEIKRNCCNHFKDALLVTTCHRVEAYYPFPISEDPIEKALGIKARCIRGKDALENRLMKISCGVQSVILGEKFIYYQVAQAVNALPDDHTMKRFGNNVLKNAKQVRENHNFYAVDDYEGISLSLINKWVDGTQFKTLIVVGAGMLSLQVAQYASRNNYTNVVMISRVAKKFRKKNRENPYPFQVCSLNTLPEDLYDNPFHCFIATTNICETYQTRLLDIVSQNNCKSVIDMSSIPAFQSETVTNKLHITMYDDPYLKEVTRSNQKLMPVKELVKNDIQNTTLGDAQ